MKNKEYIQFLTDKDKLQVKFIENRGRILKFAVQYSALIGGCWRQILRIDNFHHNGKPHKHCYYLKKKRMIVYLGADVGGIFTEAKKHIVANYEKIKENYLLTD
ncbi:MAG: hypothetical protein WC450_10805 [Candidatus Omnitrophota bacterium]